ncbi:MAG: alpha-amylase family glycosyl hydrolase [Acutalibacteraceae bacterium]|nr:alpha-amylase family glycosyl hydrolase [Acutalibacteraceae bacterium]
MMDKDYPEAALVSEWCHPVRSLYKGGFHMDFYLDHRGNGYSTLFRYDVDGEDMSFFSKNGKGDVTVFTDEFVPNLKATKDCGYISMFTCNHDIPRMSKNLDDTARRLAFCTIFTLPGVPFLYYGDEIGMRYQGELTSKEGGFGRTGSRTPMQWDSSKNMGFSTADADKLYLPVDCQENAPTVENQENDPASIFHTVKNIIKIRHENNAELGPDGDFEVIYAERNKYPFVYKRGSFIVGVNPSSEAKTIDFSFDTKEVVYQIGNASVNNSKLTLEAQSFVLLKL